MASAIQSKAMDEARWTAKAVIDSHPTQLIDLYPLQPDYILCCTQLAAPSNMSGPPSLKWPKASNGLELKTASQVAGWI